ncbi:MAG: hypothetical protein IPL20_07650 [Saprospiraceae bacterium]|nr:hypothetical protein [Saprospiraceae bacterium]
MRYVRLLIILFFCLIVYSESFSQKFQIFGFGGHSYYINKNAGGYDLGLGLNYKFSNRSSMGVSIGHSYNDVSPLPKDLTLAKVILKEESNRLPLGFGLGDWENEQNWPKIRLEEQPNRYFRFNFGVYYIFKNFFNNIKNFNCSLGAVFSYRDESELIKMIETTNIGGVFVRPTYNHVIPVFNYNTFLDAGLKCGFTYSFKIKKALYLGYNAAFVIYPKSGSLMINNGVLISM